MSRTHQLKVNANISVDSVWQMVGRKPVFLPAAKFNILILSAEVLLKICRKVARKFWCSIYSH